MSYNYLFDTYRFISEELDDAQKMLLDEKMDTKAKQFAAGRIEALCDIERFISENFESKLPRRLRKKKNRR